jgi:hypothetical protein
MLKYLLFIILAFTTVTAIAQHSTGFSFKENPAQKQVEVFYNDQLLTAYCYYESSRKPILFPVNTVDGITVTRGYPFVSVPGERTDHPHHTGIWLNYESVNGLDFWNNSTAIAPAKRDHYGTIVHQQIVEKKVNGNNASLSVTATWIRPDTKVLLNEKTTFHFSVVGNNFIIDRVTTLTATDTLVQFKDVKDGLFAIRVARELELPSKEKSSYVDDKGNITTVPPSNAADVNGMYYSSNGKTGDSVWSSRANWVMLAGKKDGKEITVAIIDHPLNISYPAYWHARGYGLFAVNPLGASVFSNGKHKVDLTLQPKQSTTFRYRVVIHSGKILSADALQKLATDFEKVK